MGQTRSILEISRLSKKDRRKENEIRKQAGAEKQMQCRW